jgi:cysteine desulfurase/selenocysteine lyase
VHAVPAGAVLRVVPVTPAGELDVEAYARLLGPRTKLVALTHVSNALGTVNPVRELARLARERGIPVLLDGAQAVPHFQPDLQQLGCDFYVFSAHKLFGPTGLGVLWMRSPWLEKLPPFLGGGDMIETVAFEGTTFQKAPNKFEAGTPNIAGAIGLHAALDYLDGLDRRLLESHETSLLDHATRKLSEVDGVTIVGNARHKVPVLSFTVRGAHPHDVGTILDAAGIAIRAGHHCTQPLMRHLGLPGTARASLAFYNTREEVDALAAALPGIVSMFS